MHDINCTQKPAVCLFGLTLLAKRESERERERAVPCSCSRDGARSRRHSRRRGCFCLVFVVGRRAASKHKPSALEGFIHAALLVQPAGEPHAGPRREARVVGGAGGGGGGHCLEVAAARADDEGRRCSWAQ